VYDYAAGKADWGSFGLPLEGDRPSSTRVAAFARSDVPTCRPDERMPVVRERVRAAGWSDCLVTNGEGVLLGRLGRAALAGDADIPAGDAMTLGPGTVRPSFELDKAVERMRARNLTSLPVTRLNGTVIGLLRLEDAESSGLV
jgi:CBS domain-containing protein